MEGLTGEEAWLSEEIQWTGEEEQWSGKEAQQAEKTCLIGREATSVPAWVAHCLRIVPDPFR